MKRIQWLQSFFDELQRDKILRSSEFFSAFLSLPQKPQWETKKKEFTKMAVPKNFADIKHFGGKCDIQFDERKIKLAKNIVNYMTNGQATYQQIVTAVDSTTKIILLLSDALARNADLFKHFSLLHADVEVFLKKRKIIKGCGNG